jgi:hypothetical protein
LPEETGLTLPEQDFESGLLVGLAARNAILIVGFARQKEEGAAAGDAAVHAAHTRLENRSFSPEEQSASGARESDAEGGRPS